MNLVALFFLTFIFARTTGLTYAQDKTDSKDVKKPEVTKPADIQKSTDVTKSKDITTPIDVKTLGVIQSKVTGNKHAGQQPDGIKTDVVTKGTGIPVNKVCIVSGEDIDSKITADYKSKTYAFCCKKCLAKFTKDPEKYVAKFQKQRNKLN